jgi:predicted RNA-binding protein YlxR (DUF448 family)
VRVVRTPDGRVVFDETGRIAGRGAYLCADGACWNQAMDKGTLQRALEAPLPEEIRTRLRHGPMHHAASGATMNDVNGGEAIGKE